MSQVIQGLQMWQQVRASLKGSIGFVPTMGALHAGHISLMERSKAENDVTVVSIFVNPTQFNNKEDFEKYPICKEDDLAVVRDAGVDYLVYPLYDELYADQYTYRVSEHNLSQRMEGQHRPGHFDGVLTVVMKLFGLVKPHRAYFGEKDYQQLALIRGMSEAFFLGVDVVACPTVREQSGLAMSSRNLRLSDDERTRLAPLFYKYLTQPITPTQVRGQLEQNGFRVDYIEEHEGRRFGAAFLGAVRLIDNVPLPKGTP